ncbi:MAG: hypothetical protein GX133_04120 [Syntrophomonadaceae bacterium]|nr:hypothetical protein [Syntrophomonadaceae bacterium]
MNIFDRLFEGGGRILAEVEIVGEADQAYCNFKTPNNINLIILLSAYFTKIRWYMETEPKVQLERMKRLYDEALEKLPEAGDYFITSCTQNRGNMVFTAQVIRLRNGNIGLINEMPDALGDMDSPDSCFVLFKAVWERLNDDERQRMVNTLQELRKVIMEEDFDRSGRGLERAYLTTGVIADLVTRGHWEYL